MNKADIRRTVAGHLVAKGYAAAHFAWHVHKPWCDIVVGTDIMRLVVKTRDSKRARERELSRVPRRGPARAHPMMMKDDGGVQLDLVDLIGDYR